MTAVMVRHEYDGKAKYLADVPFDELDSVIPTIKSWGIETDEGEPDMSGQFVYGESGAYFEVVLHVAEDES